MLVWESMEASISICTCAKSSIRCSSRPIPCIEFYPTNSLEDEGRLFVHSNSLKQVHIIYTSVTKLLLVERLILLYLLSATDGNTVAVCDHRNVIVCKRADRPPVSYDEGTKAKDHAKSCDPSPEHEPEPRLEGPDENARFTPPINFFILHNTCNNNNTQQQVPSTLDVSISISRTGGSKISLV
jgi:hypothetical protein